MSSDEGASAADSDWELRYDEGSGQAFYVNIKTGESSWDPPTVTELPLPSVDVDPSAQQQWAEAFDESGNTYYVNLVTMETRWTPPPSAGADPDEPQAAAAAAAGTQAHRPRRPSTAEQMAELNRLLSGGDDDDESDEADAASSGSDGPVTSGQDATATAGGCAWMTFVNEGDGQPYYYNHVTGECMWDPPEEFVQFHNQQQDTKSRPVSPSTPVHQVEVDVLSESQAQGSSRLATVERLPQVADGVESAESAGADVNEKPVGDGNRTADIEASVGSSADDAVIITSEFENKVRRAIEAVSKTPMGSSRLLLVRAPTGLQLPSSTRPSDGSEQQTDQLQQGQLSQRFRPSPGTRPTSAAMRVSNSRPASASLTEEPIASPPGTQEIDESIVSNTIDESLPEVAPSNEAELPRALDSSEECVPPSDEHLPPIEPEDATHSSVELSYPENALPEASGDKSPMPSSEHEHSHRANPETLVSASAVILQCAVRCFVARNKVRSMRVKQVDKEEQAPEHEPNLAELNNPMGRAEGGASELLDSSIVDSTPSSDETAVTTTANADGGTVEVAPTVETLVPSEPPQAEMVISPLPNTDRFGNNLAEIAPLEPPASSEQVPSAATTSRAASPADVAASVELPISVVSRHSPSRASARSARVLATTRKRDATCCTPSQCPQVLSLANIFPVRSTRLVTGLGDPAPLTVSSNAGGTADAVDKAPRKLPPWMREPTRSAALDKTHQPSSIQAAEAARPPPNLLQQYAHIYSTGQHEFEAERQRLVAERAEQIHPAAVKPKESNQAKATIKDDDASNSKAGLVCSFKQLRDALEMQDEDENTSAQENGRADLAVADPGYSDSENENKQRRRCRELEGRIKLAEGSISRVEAQLEIAELCLVDDDDQVPSVKRLLQTKYASKLRRRLRSLLSSATHWRQVLLGQDKDSDMSKSHHTGQLDVSEYRSWTGDSALHYAAWRGWHEQVLHLIKAGADVNRVDNSVTKWRPLHEASRGGHEAVVRELIAAGALLTAADASGDTALHVACRAGRIKVVCELLLAAAGAAEASSDCRDVKTAVKKSMNNATTARATVFFGIRNGKRRRAIDLAMLPTLVAFLEEYESLLHLERVNAEHFETASDRGTTKPARKKKEKAAALTSRLRA